MSQFFKKTAVLALFLQAAASTAAAADRPSYEYRIYSKGILSSVEPPAQESPVPESIPVQVRQVLANGCAVNGTNLVYAPAGGCDSLRGQWVLNQSFVKDVYMEVILTAPEIPAHYSIRSSSLVAGARGPACRIVFNSSSGTSTTAYKFVSEDDWQLCVDDKLAGYYHATLPATGVKAAELKNLLQPTLNLQIQVADVVATRGCIVHTVENSVILFTPNYTEEGVDLCEVGKSLYMHPGNVLRTTP